MFKLNYFLSLMLLSPMALAKIYVDMESDPVPIVSMEAIMPFGYKSEQVGVSAQTIMLSDFFDEGSASLTKQQFLDAMADFAADVNVSVSREFSTWSMDFPYEAGKDYSQLIALVSSHWKHPRFQEDVLKLIKTKQRSAMLRQLDSDFHLMGDAINKYLSVKNLGIRPMFLGDIERITLPTIKELYSKTFVNVADLMVGVVAPKDASDLVQKILTSVFSQQGEIVNRSFNEAYALPKLELKKFDQRKHLLLVDKADRGQMVSELKILSTTILSEDEEVAFVFANHLLAENGFGSFFTDEIRTKRGLAYAVGPLSRYYYRNPQMGFIANPLSQKMDDTMALLPNLIKQAYVDKTFVESLSQNLWDEYWQSFLYKKIISEGTPSGRLAKRQALVTGEMAKKLYNVRMKDKPTKEQVSTVLSKVWNESVIMMGLVGDVRKLRPLINKHFGDFELIVIPYQETLNARAFR